MNKSIINTLLAGAFIITLAGCGENTWNDHYLDGFEGGAVYDTTVEGTYELTAADYASISKLMQAQATDDAQMAAAKAIATNLYFDKTGPFPASVALPPFLASQAFPYYLSPSGSVVDINYAEADSQPAELTALAAADTYTVTTDNYKALWGSDDNYIDAFAPAKPASAALPAMLLEALPDAANGAYAIVTYNEASTNPVFGSVEDTPQVYLDTDFTDGLGDFTLDNVTLPEGSTYVWKVSSYGDDHFMNASAYVNKACRVSEGWLLSPEITLGAKANATLSFDQCYKNFKSLENALQEATVWVREKGKDWSQLTVATYPDNTSYDFVNTGDLDLSAYNGKTVQIGWCYTSSTESAGTWRVTRVLLQDGAAARSRAAVAEVPSVVKNAIYTFNGSKWNTATGVSVLNPADYTAMGFKNNSLEDPAIYLPTYLKNKFPYAQNGDQQYVVYNGKKVGLYVFDGTAWQLNNNGYEQVVGRFSRQGSDWKFVKYIGKALFTLFDQETLELNRSYIFVSGDVCSTPVSKTKTYDYLQATAIQVANNTITMATDNNALTFTTTYTIDGVEHKAPEGTFLIRDTYDRYLYLKGTYSSFNVGDTPTLTDGEIDGGYLWKAERLEDGTWRVYCERGTQVNNILFSTKYNNFAAYTTQSEVDVYPSLFILD